MKGKEKLKCDSNQTFCNLVPRSHTNENVVPLASTLCVMLKITSNCFVDPTDVQCGFNEHKNRQIKALRFSFHPK